VCCCFLQVCCVLGQTPQSLSEYIVSEVRAALEGCRALPKAVTVGLDVELDTCAGTSLGDVHVTSLKSESERPSAQAEVEGGEALALESSCVREKEEEEEAEEEEEEEEEHTLSGSEASATWQHSQHTERLLLASVATMEYARSPVREEGGGSTDIIVYSSQLDTSRLVSSDVSVDSSQLPTAPAAVLAGGALEANEAREEGGHVRRISPVDENEEEGLSTDAETPLVEDDTLDSGETILEEEEGPRASSDAESPPVEDVHRRSTVDAETPLVDDDTLDSGETLLEDEEPGRVIFSDGSETCSPCPSVSDPADVDAAITGTQVEGEGNPCAQEVEVRTEVVQEEADPATHVAKSKCAILLVVVTLQCAVRGWRARKIARTMVLDNFAHATPARVFRVCQGVQQQIQNRQRENTSQLQDAQQQDEDPGLDQEQEQEQEGLAPPPASVSGGQQQQQQQQQSRRHRRRAAVRLQRQQKEQQQDMGESFPFGSPDAGAPAATAHENSCQELVAGAAAASAAREASAASPIVETPGVDSLQSSTQASVGAQASRKRDLEMRLLRCTPQEVKSQLAPRCLFPTSPLISGAAVNRRLSLSGKKTKTRKHADQVASVVQPEIKSESLDAPSLADTQMSTETHRQTSTPTPVKEEWLAECGVQTDAHRPGSHVEAPHTPAEKRSVHPRYVCPLRRTRQSSVLRRQ
jgi:hypothetical protein